MLQEKDFTDNDVDDETVLETQLDHLYRFTGITGSTLRADMLAEDALTPILALSTGTDILIYLCKSDNLQHSLAKKIGLDSIQFDDIDSDDIAALGTDSILLCNGQQLKSHPQWISRVLGDLSGHSAIIPLWAYGRPLGFLFVHGDSPFEDRTLKLIHIAGRQLALAVENARLFEDLEKSYHNLLYKQEEIINSECTAAVAGLAATMAHEIRNPLATIFSSLSQIKKHAHVTGDAATLLNIAEEEAVRMNRIISGLVEFARPGIPRFDKVNLVDIVSDVIKETGSFDDFVETVQIELQAETQEICAEVDAGMIKKALLLLMSNALAAVDSLNGKIVLKIMTDMEQYSKRDVVKIMLEDNGHGVSSEVQNKVFEPFYSTKPSGIGLGLPTVSRIIEDHGGKVSFDSKHKQGTVVSLTLFKEHKTNSDS